MSDEWPFDQPRNCAVISLRQIVFDGEPILHVTHDLDDHGWQFLTLADAVDEDASVVSLEHIVNLDSTVLQVADMPPVGMRGEKLSTTNGNVKSTSELTPERSTANQAGSVIIASRTPEGLPSNCPLCGATTNLEFSEPTGDAPCPNCGHLLWRSTQLLSQFQQFFAESLGIPETEINAHTSLIDDLAADSLDVVELLMAFEDENEITIPDDEYENIHTIGDAIRGIERLERGD